MAIFIEHKPLGRRAGSTMLWCVAGFGVATILFGLSRSLVLSLFALFFVGATDMVSVIVRQTLIQVGTPDEMRGRANAVDVIFIGASNELGQFESGLTAQWFGPVRAVVLGGLGTLVVTGLWAWCFPELRRTNKLDSGGLIRRVESISASAPECSRASPFPSVYSPLPPAPFSRIP